MTGLPRIGVVYDVGAVGIVDIASALQGVAEPVFICPDSRHISQPRDLMAEFGILCDIVGLAAIEAADRTRKHNLAGILTFSDYQLELTAQLAALLKLPFNTLSSVRALTRKHVQRELLNAVGASDAPTRLVTDAGSAWKALHRIGLPAVLKPDHGTGSRSTYRIRTREDLGRACAELFGEGSGQGAAEAFVLEAEIRGATLDWPWGDYVSVESAVQDGQFRHLATTGKFPLAEPYRETGSFLPAALPADLHRQVLSVVTRALTALQAGQGLCHTEVKLTPDGPQVIEVNGRLGGRVQELLAQSMGINAIELAARIALGEAGAMDVLPDTPYSIAFLYASVPPIGATRLLSVQGTDELQRKPEISRVILHQKDGTELDWRRGQLSNTYVCYGSVATHDELARVIAGIGDTVEVIYE
ncbi:acetyl-CoA carboxylase biotin carboxylase subunit family protein [Streptomyces hirsutus]|uniref:ATP-grasp domain-containing protein n=1 Tax=Streptomyces hirsutus TaxID=35620 RepID=UPI0036A1F5D3